MKYLGTKILILVMVIVLVFAVFTLYDTYKRMYDERQSCKMVCDDHKLNDGRDRIFEKSASFWNPVGRTTHCLCYEILNETMTEYWLDFGGN